MLFNIFFNQFIYFILSFVLFPHPFFLCFFVWNRPFWNLNFTSILTIFSTPSPIFYHRTKRIQSAYLTYLPCFPKYLLRETKYTRLFPHTITFSTLHLHNFNMAARSTPWLHLGLPSLGTKWCIQLGLMVIGVGNSVWFSSDFGFGSIGNFDGVRKDDILCEVMNMAELIFFNFRNLVHKTNHILEKIVEELIFLFIFLRRKKLGHRL